MLNTTDMRELNQALEKITSEKKWYAISTDENKCVWLRVTASRIRKGTAGSEAIKRFFSTFGYNVTIEQRIAISR